MKLIDTHCHLDYEGLGDRLPEVLQSMREASVVGAITIGVKLEELPRLFEIAEAHPNVWLSVGVHPECTDVEEPDEDRLVALCSHPKVVAIGETGLDYYWHKDAPEWQRARFRTHIRAAKAIEKPLVVHFREACPEGLSILKEEGPGAAGGVLHCFTGTLDEARNALDLGFMISLSGIVTFKNAHQIKEVARFLPLDRILIETDSPYLAPVPYRGKPNQPSYVIHVAEEIALLRGISLEEFADTCFRNTLELFKPLKAFYV